MAQFKFVPIPVGSGWISGFVAIDEYYIYPPNGGTTEMCLNCDTQDFAEFSAEVDRLIDELEHVREVARRKFATFKP